MEKSLHNVKGNTHLKGNVLNRFPTAVGLFAATLVLALVPSYAMADPPVAPDPSPATSPTATSSQDEAMTVTVSTPTAADSPITVTVTGLREGQWIDIDGYPDGWADEAPYHKEVQQRGSGPLETQLGPPLRGWPDGTYRWIITLPGGIFVRRSFTFTRDSPTSEPEPKASPTSAPTSTKPTTDKPVTSKPITVKPETEAPREKTRIGGLAKTGR